MKECPNKSIRFWMLLTVVLLLPVVFFGLINLYHLQGLPVYFAQLALYGLFFLLAFMGLKKDEIPIPINWKNLLAALFVAALAWSVYALVQSVMSQVQIADELAALREIPAWKIGANILSTWIFVGLAEELLFRGYFLTRIKRFFENRGMPRVTLLAILISSLMFAVWHFPVRIFELVNGESSCALILLSMLVLFALGIGFAWLFIRTNNILLVGLVHGVMDFPLIGEESQLSFVMLIAAILIVEIIQLMNRKNAGVQEEEDF